jgi:hypothetical protein
MGASLSIGLPDRGPLTNRGASIRRRVPIVGRCFRLLPLREFSSALFRWAAKAAPPLPIAAARSADEAGIRLPGRRRRIPWSTQRSSWSARP